MQSTLWGLGPPTASPALPFKCPQCSERFKTNQALGSHRQKHRAVRRAAEAAAERPAQPLQFGGQADQPVQFAREAEDSQEPGVPADEQLAADEDQQAADVEVTGQQTEKKRKLTKSGVAKETCGAAQRKRYKAGSYA
jgi:C2H2-type zinc finger